MARGFFSCVFVSFVPLILPSCSLDINLPLYREWVSVSEVEASLTGKSDLK